jgi:hypothetical protein
MQRRLQNIVKNILRLPPTLGDIFFYNAARSAGYQGAHDAIWPQNDYPGGRSRSELIYLVRSAPAFYAAMKNFAVQFSPEHALFAAQEAANEGGIFHLDPGGAELASRALP